MKKIIYIFLTLAFSNAYGVVFQVDQTDTAGLLTTYNALVLNDFTTNSEIEGRLVVLNDVNGNQISNVAFKVGSVPSTDQTLVVGGNVNVASNIQVQTGTVLLKNSTTTNIQNQSALVVDNTLDLSQVATTLQSFSSQMGGLVDDSSYTSSGGSIEILVSASLSGVAVVTIDGADLASAQNLFTYTGLNNVDALVINITGSVTDVYANTNDATASSKVFFNFSNGEDFTTRGSFRASIIAPDSDITNGGSFIEGTVVAENLDQGSQELHLPNISEDAVNAVLGVIPEPSQYAFVLSFLSIVFVGFRRSKLGLE